MDLIKFAITRPVTIAVFAILIVLFGIIGITRLPVQLTPDTELPQIEVYTQWPGATPSEMENNVVETRRKSSKAF